MNDRKSVLTPLLIVPGINDSEPSHWQSIWQSGRLGSVRLAPTDWNYPILQDWMAALEKAIGECSSPPIAIGHSLGCILMAYWAGKTIHRNLISGAFLVAPPDPRGTHFPVEAPSFRIEPQRAFGFPCVVLASSNDPYSSIERAQGFADKLNAGFVSVGPVGHINSESNIGAWSQGRDLLECFAAGLSVRI
jgi:uncharacterized protein